MNRRVMPMLLAAAIFAAPSAARAAGAIGEARGVSANPTAFDGTAPRPTGDPVVAGSTGDRRTAEQIASDEQRLADERSRAAVSARVHGPDKEIEPPKPNEWLKSTHIITGVKGAMIGLLVGSLWGLTGLGIGVLVGGLIGYGLSKITAS